MERENFYQSILPVIDEYRLKAPHADWRVFIFGPNEDEIRQFAPGLAKQMDEATCIGDFSLVPVDDQIDLVNTLDTYATWWDDMPNKGGHALILPVPSAPINRIPFEALEPDAVTLLPHIAPALAIASLIPCTQFIALFEHDTTSYAIGDLLRFCGSRFLERLEYESSFEYRRDMRHRLRRSFLYDKERRDFLNNRDSEDAHRESLDTRTNTRNPHRPFELFDGSSICPMRPEFSWCIEDVGGRSLSLIKFPYTVSDLKPEYIHFRAFQNSAQVLSAMDDLVSIVAGEGNRGEDDTYSLIGATFARRSWSALHPPIYDVYTRKTELYGYPLVRLSDIVDSIDMHPQDVSKNDLGRLLYFQLAGSDWGRATLTPPAESTIPHLVRMRCSDPITVARLLNDSGVRTYLRCTSYGSWDEPRIPIGVLKEIRLPWPGTKQAQQLEQRCKDWSWTAGEMVQEAETLVEMLSDIEDEYSPRSWPDLESRYSGDHPGEPNVNLPILDDLREQREEIFKSIQHLASYAQANLLDSESSSQADNYKPMKPAFLAIQEQRAMNAQSSVERLDILFDYAETLVRLDVLVQLAAVRDIDSTAIASIFSHIPRKKSITLTFGQWIQIQRESRKALSLLRDSNKATTPVDQLVQQLTGVNTKQIANCVDKLVVQRNRFSHKHTPPESQASRIIENVQDGIRALVGEIPYLESGLLLYVHAVDRKRTHLDIHRSLLHDNRHEFPRQIIQRDLGHPLEFSASDTVYFQYDLDHEHAISLWPWVIFECGEDDDLPAIWLFDRLASKAVFTSPMRPTKDLEDESIGQTLQQLLGR